MPFCTKCGTEIQENANFCNKCGNARRNRQDTNQNYEKPKELSLWGYYIKCFKNYANFEGRARRSEYWGFCLFNGIFLFCLLKFGNINELGAAFILTLLYVLIAFLPCLAVSARRLHDIGKSGWWWLIIFIPIIGSIILFVWTVMDSEHAENIYGKNPVNPKIGDIGVQTK
ncbi:hypothetical protein R83H12_01928 [Fibrobacteria bacterium R8-3-H12]